MNITITNSTQMKTPVSRIALITGGRHVSQPCPATLPRPSSQSVQSVPVKPSRHNAVPPTHASLMHSIISSDCGDLSRRMLIEAVLFVDHIVEAKPYVCSIGM